MAQEKHMLDNHKVHLKSKIHYITGNTHAIIKLEEAGLSSRSKAHEELNKSEKALKQMKNIKGPNWVPWEIYQLSDQKWIPNPTQVLSPNSPSNKAELPLNQRHLAKTKLGKGESRKPNENSKTNYKGELKERPKKQLKDLTSPKAG